MQATKKSDSRITEKLKSPTRRPPQSTPEEESASFAKEVREMKQWFGQPRFKDITRIYSAPQVVQQRGTIENDYPIARTAAREFYDRLRELYSRRESITTFGPYSPG